MNKRITIIINPSSGKKDSILWSINNAFQKEAITWEVQITQKKGDAYHFAEKAVKNKDPIVAVYGGDGTVAEVAKALSKTNSALFIIPGGTANIFAKEMKVPTDVDQALALLAQKTHTICTIDMARFQKEPFVLRIETGLSALLVKETKRSTKRIFGSLSYIIHLLPHLSKSNIRTFSLQIDDKQISTSGVALMIANVGNIGIEGYSVVPQSNVEDGKLDVILFKEKIFDSFFAWLRSLISGKKPKGAVQHWKAKKVKALLDQEQTIVCDDITMRTKTIEAEIIPKALKVVVPR
jgi:diacylglycerol kinase (ATP)